MPLPIGINIWSRLVEKTFTYLDQVITPNTPYDALWFPDHVQYADNRVAEGWSLMAFAMGRYPTMLCGHEVLCNSFRNPSHLAKMGATMQALSGGKFVLGIGAGWNQEEYLAYGWPFPKASVRIAMLEEAIQIIRAMWRESPANFVGQHYQIANAHCEPRPTPTPPVMVGGTGEKHLLRVVAQHANWWNYVFTDLPAYAHKQRVLMAHCQDVGRNYAEIQQVVVVRILISETEAELARLKLEPHLRPLEGGFAGTPEQITEALLPIIRQGAHRLSVNFADAPNPQGTLLFAERVLPHLA
jgi:alkanesulfonate monooxygenase SsuD/methylene tetrahydromethanopterin reductase-like flavin-dependent oxidoreductase (luciferase family)